MKIVVITPTYNEAGNIETLVRLIHGLRVDGLKHIIIDDNSPDGTGTIAERLKSKYGLTVIHRDGKQGLGTAYVEAFKYVLNLPERPRYVIQMDADLSHNPSNIPNLLEAIKGSDVALGSRYVKGGNIENWDFFRRMISFWSNAMVRTILAVPIKDLTGGFKCWKIEVLEKIDLDSLSSTHYNFQIETTYKALKQGFKVAEIPISFTERTVGKSKFNIWIMMESFFKVFTLRWKS